jgi:DNA-binding NarL/FixJ family response regulator
MNILILLADDHKIMRDCLRVLIEQEKGMDVIGETATGEETIRLAARLKPDVVVLDVIFPDISGFEVARRLLRDTPGTRILGLSMYSDARYVREMIAAGADGYILKSSAFEDLCKGIRAVHDGRHYLGHGIPPVVKSAFKTAARKACDKNTSTLSDRELDVLGLLARGKSTREIAEALELSPKTIGTHRANIMEKLQLHSIAELTKYAIRQGIVALP